MYQTSAIEAPNTVLTSGLVSYFSGSKALNLFSKKFSAPIAFPSLVFDSAFVDQSLSGDNAGFF